MAGTSTVPTILAGETGYQLTMSWIDENEKEFSSTFLTKANPSDAEIQALVTAAQAGSNASLYRVEATIAWEGAKAASNAASAVHESAADKIRLSLKDITTKAYARAYLPAPLEVLVGDGGVVDTSQAVYTAWRDAVLAVKLASFTGLNVEFVQYQQRNEQVTP